MFRSSLRRLAVAISFGVCALVSNAQAQTPLKKTLPNGLTVLVLENHAAPVVAVRAYVKTGSIYEGQYLGAGISHLFEHTLFEGTQTRTKFEINNELQAIGGQSNAYTSYDVTAYHITTASSYFDRALNLTADMLQHASFPEAEVKTQQGVIHNEMNLDEDDPQRVLSDLFYATAFRVHPVRLPIIGFKPVFDRLTRDDIVSYYKSHYTPENTVLTVAGDVSSERVFDAVETAFKDWERRTASTPAIPDEPMQTTPRRAIVEKPINLTYLQMGWHTIPIYHPDLYAMDVLAQIVGGGESSRLVRELREKQNLVSSIAAYSSTPNFNGGIFAVTAQLPPANQAKVENAILAQVGKVWRDGVSPEELKRAQRQIASAFVFNNTEVDNQAEQMAYDELGTGDPAYSRRYVSRIQAVTPAEVRAVAIKYLTRDGLTTAIVRPVSAKVRTSALKTPALRVAAPKMVRLSNGMRLIIRENHATPTVAIVAMGAGGVRSESAKLAGISGVTAKMLTRGTAKRNGEEIASLVDSLGGDLDGFNGYNAWGVQSQWLSSDWRKGLTLLSESLLTPTFPDEELARVKAQTVAQITEQKDDPLSAASLLLRRTFYGAHPYGRSSLGTTTGLKAITRDDVQAYWNQVFLPRSTVLTIYGDVDAKEAQRVAEFMLGRFKREGKAIKAPPAPPVLSQFTLQQQATGAGVSQTALFYGFPGIRINSPDRYALAVLDAALSGASLPGGRLFQRLRDDQLVYDVNAFDQPGVDAGAFVVYAATTKENTQKVRDIIDAELTRARDTDFSDEELARAKTMSVAAHAIDAQTNEAQAQEAASDELFGLGFQESARYEAAINAVTLADVRRVAQQYLKPEQSALAIVGPA